MSPSASGSAAPPEPRNHNRDQGLSRLLRLAADPSTSSPIARAQVAVWAAYYGETALAVEALRGAAIGSGTLTYISWLPVLRDVRPLPEFSALVDELGLVDFWSETTWPPFCRRNGDGRVECE